MQSRLLSNPLNRHTLHTWRQSSVPSPISALCTKPSRHTAVTPAKNQLGNKQQCMSVGLLMCRGPTDKAEGPRSKLARVTPTPPSMPPEGASHGSRRGATAAEAVDLSDDDDDVVIIEENMQPQGHKPSAPAPVKQPGGSAAAVCGQQATEHMSHAILAIMILTLVTTCRCAS